MPLQDHFPVIDDRRYGDILDEARARIPRYSPEWTDLNESDPGIVMLELFAWLTEMQLYRMARVPELNYLKFLELVGIELEPATAATAKIGFPVSPTFDRPTLIVPAKTQVATEDPDVQGPILFETDQALTAIRSELTSLQSDEGLGTRDIGGENADTGVAFKPFGPNAVRDNAFLLGFSEELPAATVRLSVWTPTGGGERPVSACFDAAARTVSTLLAWELWNGREWQAMTLLKDDSGAFTRDGDILLRGPAAGTMVSEAIGAVAQSRFWVRARIATAGYEQAPQVLAIRTNVITATQAETLEYETVGGSNGEMDQTLRLRDAPVLPGSLILQVDEGTGYQDWGEVPDFFGSGAEDSHYVLDRATGEIRFGDGRRGRVPVANPRNSANVRARSYRVGGGRRGNLPAGSLNVLQSSVRGVDATGVTNLFPTAGGAEEESLDAAIKRAPQALKTRERAVTNEDFEELAMRAGNIARAKALPLHHPDFPGVEVPGAVSVLVIPDIDDPAPKPSAGTLRTVCAYLNQRRLMTTELYVLGPVYRTVRVIASLVVEDSADLAEVKGAAMDNLALYFHPLDGGEDSDADKPTSDPERKGTGWPFGGDIYYSLLYRRLLQSGVKRISELTIEIDGDAYPACRDVALEDGVLLAGGEHDIQVDYEVLV